MANDFNTLLHGEASDAAELLGTGRLFTELELRAALTNALNRIDHLESKLDSEVTRIENQVQRCRDSSGVLQ